MCMHPVSTAYHVSCEVANVKQIASRWPLTEGTSLTEAAREFLYPAFPCPSASLQHRLGRLKAEG